MRRPVFSDHYPTFLEVLIAARKKAGISQVDLSLELNRPQQFVSRYETKQRRIDVIEFIAIARALGVEPQEMFAQVLKKLPKSIKF